MEISFNKDLSNGYVSKSQIARVLTESWTTEYMYCPICGCSHICKFPNNQAVADFYCPNCHNEFEQKSKDGVFGSKIADGAYTTFIERITSNNNPDFLIMNYSLSEMKVKNMFFIPKYFFVPDVVEKRKPLSENAKRAGWVGCNILLNKIPQQGRIPIIYDSIPIDKAVVIEKVKKTQYMNTDDIAARGWLFDVLHCVNMIDSVLFSLDTIYCFENMLAEKHPNNHNIRAKIRQQLQQLRDRGIITFLGNGHYQKVDW